MSKWVGENTWCTCTQTCIHARTEINYPKDVAIINIVHLSFFRKKVSNIDCNQQRNVTISLRISRFMTWAQASVSAVKCSILSVSEPCQQRLIRKGWILASASNTRGHNYRAASRPQWVNHSLEFLLGSHPHVGISNWRDRSTLPCVTRLGGYCGSSRRCCE